MFELAKIIEKLQTEAREIEYELKVSLPEEIGAAIDQGDISENAEYESAKERQSTLIGRLEQINRRIEELTKINLNEIPRDRVSLGSTVTVTNLVSGERRKFVLVPPEAMDGNRDYISVMSPIASHLVGAYPGDEVFVRIPRGDLEFRIERVITYFGDVLE